MLIFWIIIICFIVLRIILKKNKLVDKYSFPMVLLAFSFLIIAIVTNDPIFTRLGVPMEFEWVVGLFITGLSSWKLYFNPLKERAIRTERKVSTLKSEVDSIKEDTSLIKNILIKNK